MGKGASMKSSAVYMTDFKSLTLKGRGKVRDIYDFGDRLLIVATDRVSAFGKIFVKEGIAEGGRHAKEAR